MTRPILRLIAFLLVLAGPHLLHPDARSQAISVTFFVTPSGNDAWSGALAEPNQAQTDGPFATLRRARDAVRRLRREQGGRLRQPVTVFVRGGMHFLREPLVFTPEDSGTPEAPVAFAAHPDEQPVISGGRRITGWREVTVNGRPMWATDIPEVREGRWFFRQLWVNGERRVRARHPNSGYLRIARLPDVTPQTQRDQGQNRFEYSPGDIRPWPNLDDVDVVLHHFWVGARLKIASIDEQRRLVTFSRPTRYRMTETGFLQDPARYYLEHAQEFLDSPGEWYLDRKAGTLYYLPMLGEDVRGAEVIAPVLNQLIQLQGAPLADRFVEHMNFRGLTFAHTDWLLPDGQPMDVPVAASPLPAVISGQGIRNLNFEGVTVSHVGTYAFEFPRSVIAVRIAGCHLFDLGAGGISLAPSFFDTEAPQSQRNEVTDCHIHDGGIVFPQGIGVVLRQGYGNRIAHNHVHDLAYIGIALVAKHGYGPSLARDNIVEHNHIHHIGVRSNGAEPPLNDLGGIYAEGEQPGTTIRFNLLHDIAAHRYGGWGIYLDEGSTQIVVESNVVHRTSHGGFHLHYGRENIVRNNIFAFGRDAQITRSRQEPHLNLTFERNIIYWKDGDPLRGDFRDINFRFDRNLYWRVSGGAIRFAGLSWDEWRRRGNDSNSLIADPRFAAPERDDFELRADSVALRIGFQPVDLRRVGPRSELLERMRGR